MATRTPTPRRPRLAPALVTDLPVLLALTACTLLLPVTWAHIASGLAMTGLAVAHLRTRRGLARRVLRRPRSARRFAVQVSSWLLVAAVAAVTATGLLRWAGWSPERTWHGGTGWALLGAVTGHLWLVRHRLRRRLRVYKGSSSSSPSSPDPTKRPISNTWSPAAR